MHILKKRKKKNATLLDCVLDKGRKRESQYRWLKGLILSAIAFSVKN